ncbi:thiol:disulfide interchange protein [Catenovulum agarivorans DS-2]|uniref:Thiol:disulfide interchange protein n=2 Tax=Catenovulum agarivorans TaxID=1172192 RepID=W7QJN0_9ALTE|nr:thiol:disulfide interchange protein [Catenovulum agarivorans DS-2]
MLWLTSIYAELLYAEQSSATGPHIQVQLVSEYTQLNPTQTNWIGILLKPEPHWHTYWRNPGDSGEAPSMQWQLPSGLSVGEIIWPIPQQINVAHLVNYGYEGQNLLMLPLTFTSSAQYQLGQQIEIKVDLSWLVCQEDCVPGWATLTKTFEISNQQQPSAFKPLFAQTRQRHPQAQKLSGRYEITDKHIVVSANPPTSEKWQLLPLKSSIIQHNKPQQIVASTPTQTSFTVLRSDYFIDDKQPIEFLLSDGESAYYLTAQYNTGLTTAAVGTESPHLALILLMALAGGIILNLMPCVLPVLSIKALSLQQQNLPTLTKFAYLLGVLISFNLFALAIVIFRQGGESLGWGFQMQSPWFVALMAFLFLAIALMLLDQIKISNGLTNLGQSWVSSHGFASQFATGVLAVLVASPCTAPFMAASIGVAMVSPPLQTMLIFTSLALGFALPLTVIFCLPKVAKLLPKPGAWMESFRQFLAFPMLATVIWLVWIYLNQTNSSAQLILLSALLLFALFCWLAQHSKGGLKVLCGLAIIACIVAPFYFSKTQVAIEQKTQHTQSYLKYDANKLAELKANNQVVLVNMTADWCITCKVNEQVAFNSSQVQTALADDSVHYMVGDWTNKNSQILSFLQQYQRAGVPLYVVYAGNHSEQVLPQLLTPAMLIEAINLAKKELNHES